MAPPCTRSAQPLGVEALDVAAHGHVGHAELVHELGHPRGARFLERARGWVRRWLASTLTPSLTTAAVRGDRCGASARRRCSTRGRGRMP